MKILEARIENVLGCKLVEVSPNGESITLAGKHGSGKSSALEAICLTLEGLADAPIEPIRRGARRAECRLNLGDILVTRTWTHGGCKLEVKSAAGVPQKRPQELLDSFIGKLSFDPLAFARMAPRDQLAAIKGLIGLDTSDLEREREDVYAQRTDVNRDLKRLEASLASLPDVKDAPDSETSIAALAAELEAANRHNATIRAQRDKLEVLAQKVEESRKQLQRTIDQIRELEAIRDNLIERIAGWETAHSSADGELAVAKVIDTDAITARMADIEELNRKARVKQQRAKLQEELKRMTQESIGLSERLTAIDSEKRQRIVSAAFPVDGVSVDEDCVTYRGIPFQQLSTAEQTRISVEMAMQANPQLRVMFIRRGNDLDDSAIAALKEAADAKDYQLWIERYSGGPNAVVIEDGEVVESAFPAGDKTAYT